MSISNDFKTLCEDIALDNLPDMEISAGEIAKELNNKALNAHLVTLLS